MRVPFAVVVSVGDALVTGRRPDRIGIRVAQWLEAQGCEVRERHIVPDDEALIAAAIRAALAADADLVIACGGLGPSTDDRTREGIARALDVPLELDSAAAAATEQRYRERGLEVPEGALRQAYRPQCGTTLPNCVGTATGLLVDRGRTLLLAVPGVQREMQEMLERSVGPAIRQRLQGALAFRATVLHIAGLQEMEVDRRIASALDPDLGARVALLSAHGEVDVLLSVRGDTEEDADERLGRVVAAVEAPIGDHVYGRDGQTLAGVVRDELLRRGWRLGVGESFTGGLLAKTIVDLPGASEFFAGAIVPYSDSRKPELLGVPPFALDRYGAVSAEVVLKMAEGVRDRLRVEVALAAAGIGGPSGGSQERPVGLTYLSLAWPGRTIVRRFVFSGDRSAIRTLATVAALDQARRALLGLPFLGEDAHEQEGAAP